MNKLEKMSDKEYFEAEGLSQSFLKAFDKSPAFAFSEKPITDSMEDGALLHCLVLEPELFDNRYMIIDREKNGRNTKIYKEIVLRNPDKKILFHDEIRDFYDMRDNVLKLTYDFTKMSEMVLESQKEISCFSEILGFKCKGKFDLLYNNEIIFDLKLTSNIEKFKWQVKDFGYYRQADFYKTLLSNVLKIPYEQVKFIIIAVENKFPFGAKTYELTDEYIQIGGLENMRSIQNYSAWLQRGGDKTEIYYNTHEII